MSDTYYSVLVKIYKGIAKDHIMDYANWLRSNEPQSPLEEIAERLIKRHTKNSASMGAITALPANIPVVGTIMSVGGLGVDFLHMVREQLILFLKIAALYGFSPHEMERVDEFVECLAKAEGKTRQGVMGTPLKGKVTRNILSHVGSRMMRGRLAKVLPILGVLSGSTLNYLSLRKIGRTAIEFYGTMD
jgi:hypothetical protein